MYDENNFCTLGSIWYFKAHYCTMGVIWVGPYKFTDHIVYNQITNTSCKGEDRISHKSRNTMLSSWV